MALLLRGGRGEERGGEKEGEGKGGKRRAAPQIF